MLGPYGETLVVDWGLAKAGGEPSRVSDRVAPEENVLRPASGSCVAETVAGQVFGTPQYMSPEQAAGRLDLLGPASDVYSLGATLYCLLTGKAPFDRDDHGKLLRKVEQGDFPPPRQVKGDMPRALEAVCLKAMATRPPNRYATPRQLADDGERWLADEPVAAWPEPVLVKAGRWVRRHKPLVSGAAAALLVALVSLSAGAIWYEQDLSRQAQEQLVRQSEDAARQSWTTASVAGALRDARERVEEAWKVHDFPERMQRATDAAVAAIRRADEFIEGGSPSEATRAELAAARQDVDDLARHTRLISRCAANQRKFAEELNASQGFNPRARLADRHGEAFRQFGLDPVRGDVDEVARAIATNRLRDALLGMLLEWHVHADYMWQIRQKYPDEPDEPAGDPKVKDRLDQVVRAARHLCGGAYTRWQDLLDRNDTPGLVAFAASPDGLSFRSSLVNALARDLRSAKQYAACRAFLRAAVERYRHDVWLQYDLFRNCCSGQPPNLPEALEHVSAASVQWPDSALFRMQIAECYSALGAYEQAVAAHRKAISLYANPAYAYVSLARTLQKMKDLDGAIAALREAVRLRPKVANYHYQLGFALLEKNDSDGAIAAYREVIGLEPKNGAAHYNLGFAFHRKQDWQGAITAWREAVRLDPKNLAWLIALGVDLKEAGRHAEALQVTLDALRQNPAWADDPRTALRNNAACFSVCCADGKGANAPPPAERPALRKQALDFLSADLAALRKLVASDRELVHARMQLWLGHEDSLSLRDPKALERLPPDERTAWNQLWADFRELRDRTAPPAGQ